MRCVSTTDIGAQILTAIRRIILLAALCAALFTAVAQPAAPDVTPEPPACDDSAALSAQVAQLYLSLSAVRNGDADALGALYEVGARYQAMALDCGYLPSDINTLVINITDVDRVLEVLDMLNGDPLRGQLLYDAQEPAGAGDKLGCSGCHAPGEVAPITVGTWTRWDEERSQEERFATYDFQRYAVESILLPWDYFVAGYPEYTMPDFYHEKLSYQDLADLVAYLESQDQLP